jgi:alpha-ketoglutarate-dependent taurine dioxygenase
MSDESTTLEEFNALIQSNYPSERRMLVVQLDAPTVDLLDVQVSSTLLYIKDLTPEENGMVLAALDAVVENPEFAGVELHLQIWVLKDNWLYFLQPTMSAEA